LPITPLTLVHIRKLITFSEFSDTYQVNLALKKIFLKQSFEKFVLVESKYRFFACDTPTVNGDLNPNGVLFSRNYPNFAPSSNCVLKLQSSSPTKSFKIYITDLYIEDEYIQNFA
jgi:hypothetical protein